ncbi:imidazole glycerol phosphate synthase subunit hisH [Longilinea arvoryzae]|uniref:Imidazole glycerol phosphate synthase subunit HisH n=1 Tax=Longilinea arvoryzae TaxID=360412 RepID=A0A0S7BDE5_9CHLR|nr:imidazole glycerol phosphate synthase subunit HisH [Longilinea arvoryzae]GAP15847.1 imidazole glycerol phosphate synthase subunit hisH [Longilinea arvoryzae]
MKSKSILLVDAGTGNLRSVAHALEALGAPVRRTSDPADLIAGARILLPGVGAFGKFMAGLRAAGLDEALRQAVQRGDPVLGICVGMQALFETSREMGSFSGLGILPGQVLRFPDQPGLKVPHTGWNQLWPQNGGGILFAGLSGGDYAYFNHSYYCAADRPADVSAVTDYGLRFASMVQHENVLGVQFHPEKSQRVGLRLLRNYLEM